MSTRLLLAVAVIGALAGCSRVTGLSFPTPPPTSPSAETTSTSAPDLTGVSLAGVSGKSTPTVLIGPGTATISGTVIGPAGPVGGADVHVERLVGDAVGAADVIAQVDGTWSLPGVLGGRYRVRAWRSPDLDLTTPNIFFLGGTDTKSLTLQLDQFTGTNAAAAIAPNPPIFDQPAALAVQVTTQTVDAKGVVRAQPVAGASVQLGGSSAWAISVPNPAVTGADGTVTWQLVCSQVGPQPLSAIVNATNTYPLTTPVCSLPPPATTTTVPTTVPGQTTTTITRRTTTT